MTTSVKKVMTQKIVSVPVGTTLFEAYQLMKEKRFRHLPVVDEQDNLVGLISHRDLHYVPDSKHLTVEMLMSSPVQVIDMNAPLRSTILMMLEKKISCVLVSDANDLLVGIVTTDDILWHLANILNLERPSHTLNALPILNTIGELAQSASSVGV